MAARRTRLRFSLAAFLLVTTAATLWIGRTTYIARRQQAAVAAINAAEGIVNFYDKSPPAWFEGLVGEEYFQNPRSVDFATGNGRKQGTKDPKVSDAVLAHLALFSDIETLELGQNESVTDEQLSWLEPLQSLKTLYLYRTSVQGPGLVHLTKLRRLESLSLDNAPVGDDGAKHLGTLRGLTWLRLEGTKITDVGVCDLARLSRLETLSLANTEITDKALPHLERLTTLRALELKGTQISPAGAQRIQKALPNCAIIFSFALGKSLDDKPLFERGETATTAEIDDRLRSRGINADVRANPGEVKSIVSLYISDSTLSDRVMLGIIAQMPALETLILRQGLAGDAFLAGLGTMPLLTYLELSGMQVTDAGMKYLSKLTSLRELILNDTGITDAGLEHLRGMTNLQQLSLSDTRVTRAGIDKLKEALPQCNVNY